MKKHFISVLLIGAMVVPSFVACDNKGLDDLTRRVEVLEGAWYQTQQDLQKAVVTGLTITSANQVDGVWTIVLSDGKNIVIDTNGGGGAAVSIEETADAFIITVNSKSYTIPKVSSAAVNSLVYVPEFIDQIVQVGEEGAVVNFLATPSFNASEATFDIADAREVKTRAGAGLFKVESAENDGDLIKVTMKALAAESNKDYTVALKVELKGTAISSNYFVVHVGENSFEPEALEDPKFIDAVSATAVDDSWRAQLPDEVADFLGTFNFKSLYKELPAGNVTFELAPAELQNGQVASRYDLFKNCLAADGTWTMNTRPGTSCYDPDKDGIYIYCKVNDQIKNKVFWTVNDPIRTAFASYSRDDDGTYGDIHYAPFPESQHMEYRPMVPAGENRISFLELFLKSTPGEENDYLWFQHGDAPKAIEGIQKLEISALEPGDILYCDGETMAMGALGQKLARHSRGVWWQSTQPSVVSSQRQNLSEEQKEAVKAAYGVECNGEIIGGWDGNAYDAHEQQGWDFDSAGYFVTNASYTGTAYRFGIGMRFEYDYGQFRIGGWHTCYMFFNRRVAPEGAVDPSPR